MGGGLLPKITVEEISEASPQNKTDRESESTETEEENRVKLPKIRRTSKVNT